MPAPEQIVFPAVLVLGIERVDPRTDDLVPFDGPNVVPEEVGPDTPDQRDALELVVGCAVCGGVDGFGGARLVRGVGTRRVRSRRPLSISRLPTASAQTTGSRRNISRSGRVGPANNSARHPRRGPARACVRPRRPAPSPRGPRSRAGSYLWPVREPRRTGGRCPATAAPGRAPVPGGRAPLRGAASYEAER